MEYVLVRWIHNINEEPVFLYSEVDIERNEVRKIEVYRDGSFGFADSYVQYNNAGLALVKFPEISEISSQQEFEANQITQSEFDKVWKEKVSPIYNELKKQKEQTDDK